jgi:hypothetical protein
MAHSEACQLFIEEQIQEGLAKGKTPHSIGKDLTKLIAKMFEASIPAGTLKKRAQRMKEKLGTNVPKPETLDNHSDNPEKRPNQPLRDDKGKYVEGKPPGPGRPRKYEKSPEPGSSDNDHDPSSSRALEFAELAISQLKKIKDDDPYREEALQKVISFAEKFKIKNLPVKPLHMPAIYARLAIQQLKRIEQNHHSRKDALQTVKHWIKQHQ